MDTPDSLILACWVVFLVYWVISALGRSAYAKRTPWSTIAITRVVILGIVVVLFQVPGVRNVIFGPSTLPPTVRWIGVIVCALGVALAVSARFYLGRNWGMPMSLKANPELVTAGPYRWIRHPIYAGVLLAMIGSTLGELWWLVPLLCFAVYFIYSAKVEEKLMREQFPAQYPEYQKHSKMLVPFVF